MEIRVKDNCAYCGRKNVLFIDKKKKKSTIYPTINISSWISDKRERKIGFPKEKFQYLRVRSTNCPPSLSL